MCNFTKNKYEDIMKEILKRKRVCIIGLFLVFGLAYILLSPKGKTIDKLTSENVESLSNPFTESKCQAARGICCNGITITVGSFSIVTNDSEGAEP